MKEKKKEYKVSLQKIIKKGKLMDKTLNQRFRHVKVYADLWIKDQNLSLFIIHRVNKLIKVLNCQKVI